MFELMDDTTATVTQAAQHGLSWHVQSATLQTLGALGDILAHHTVKLHKLVQASWVLLWHVSESARPLVKLVRQDT